MLPLRIYPRHEMPLGSRYLRVGCSGRDVLSLQRALAAAGYPAEADGRFGYVTEEAVRRLQTQSGIGQDGVVGPATLTALRKTGEGVGLAVHRIRQGEGLEEVAATLGVTVGALRRHNRLRKRERPRPGTLLSAGARFLLTGPGEPRPSGLRLSAALGPYLTLSESGPECGEPLTAESFPVLRADLDIWRAFLGHKKAWPDLAGSVRRLQREQGWRCWAIDLPAQLWWHRRRLLKLLRVLRDDVGNAPVPLIRWPGQADRLPDLTGLAKLGTYLMVDPGPLAFSARSFSRLLRQITVVIPARRLIPVIRAGGLLNAAKTGVQYLTVRDARVTAAGARHKLSWDEAERVYRCSHASGKESWDLRLLEERGLRERIRTIDRLDCAGLALAGLAGLSLPRAEIWPGEFSVLDNFSPPRHID